MPFVQASKLKSHLANLIKHAIAGKGMGEKRILFGKAAGIKMCLDPAFKFQRLMGLEEKEIQHRFVRFAGETDTFLDIGASDGYYSLLYKKFNPDGKIHLFEPDSSFSLVQRKNLELNLVKDRYLLHTEFVSAFNDKTHLTIDSLHLNGCNILIKIDVEGEELGVLNGMKALLHSTNCYLIIETHSVRLENDCINFLNHHNYATQVIENAWWRSILPERRPLAHNRWLVGWPLSIDNIGCK